MGLCVCGQPTFIADIRIPNLFYKGRDHLFTLIKDSKYQKEIRGIRLNLQGNKQEY